VELEDLHDDFPSPLLQEAKLGAAQNSRGPGLGLLSVSGDHGVLQCASCTEANGTQKQNPSLALPCNGSIDNLNGVLSCD
jgi:hypothetical protein